MTSVSVAPFSFERSNSSEYTAYIIQYFSDNHNEDKIHEAVPAHPTCQMNSLLGSTCAVANLEKEREEVKLRNPDIKEEDYEIAFGIKYTSAEALSYTKLLSKRVLTFGSKWQLWI